MNEKGRCSALGGLFAVARAAPATVRKVYERLSYLLRLFFFFFSLVYQSLRFRNYFYVPSSKAGPRDDACAVYIVPSRVLRAKRMCSLWTLNLSIAIDQILEQ